MNNLVGKKCTQCGHLYQNHGKTFGNAGFCSECKPGFMCLAFERQTTIVIKFDETLPASIQKITGGYFVPDEKWNVDSLDYELREQARQKKQQQEYEARERRNSEPG